MSTSAAHVDAAMIQAEIDRLAARVRAAAHEDGLVETAQVKLVGLDEVRTAAGSRWPRMREHVREGSLRIIAQRIGPDDAAVPCGDGFLVVFADAAGKETQSCCKEIRDALIAFYLGDDALAALRADVETETVAGAELAGLIGKDTQALKRAPPRAELKLGRFWPVWSARHSAVAAYMLGPRADAARPPRLGYSPDFLDHRHHRERDFLDLDLCLLEQACAAAEESAAPIGLTVHATTMQTRRSRTIYLQHLNANASPARQRMFVAIAEIEPGTPLMSLTEWTTSLKGHLPRVALDLHASDRALSALASTGAWAAGYHLSASRVSSSAQAREALNVLDYWCRALRRQGLMPFINGFEDPALLDLATYTDLAFASGEGLWPSQASPCGLAAATRIRQNTRTLVSS